VRPADISATDEEVRLALERRDAVRDFLSREYGWGEPSAVTQSPNGGGLLYRIDLPNDDDARDLVQRVFYCLAFPHQGAQPRLVTRRTLPATHPASRRAEWNGGP
jgi:hypothetical protein